jgi:hypothetical protein
MKDEVVKKGNFEEFNSKGIVNTLHSLMLNVTKDKCNAETVNAACNCANQITQLLKLHLEVVKAKKIFNEFD